MTASIPNLWPDDTAVCTLRAPVTILREQAKFLGDKTQHVVEGLVESQFLGEPDFLDGHTVAESPSRFSRHFFYLIAPALGGYHYLLFYIQHPTSVFYPLKIFPRGEQNSKPITVESEEKFTEILTHLFAHEETKRIVRTLIAQSRT